MKNVIESAVRARRVSSSAVAYPAEIEKTIRRLIPILEKSASQRKIDARWLAVKLLEEDEMAMEIAGESAALVLKEAGKKIISNLGDDPDIMVADSRYGFINGIYQDAVEKRLEVRKTVSDAIDNVVLNRVLGIPLFLLLMYVTFMITINIGGCFIDFFDISFGTIFVAQS